MKKILVFIDHDIMIRHFLLNDTFSELEKEFEVKYCFTAGRRIQTDISKLPLKSEPAIIPFDQNRLSLYRKLYRASLMYLIRKKPVYRDTKEVWRSIVGTREIVRSSVRGHPLIYPFYKKYILRKIGINSYLENFIQKENPDMLIHPTVLEGVFVSDLISISKRNNIPSLYLMNSWDNPSTKALMVEHPDWLAVWGEQTRIHAREFLEMPDDRIICLGAAQFEAYREEPSPLPADFKKSLGLKEDVDLILFAGSGAGRGHDEIGQMKALDEAIQKGLLENCHVLFRPHPWHGSRRNEPDFYECGFKHISMDPAMEECYRLERESDSPPIYKADYRQTNVAIKASTIVISGISTMMLEAVHLGRPTICSVYDDHVKHDPLLSKVSKMYHFKEFLAKGNVVRCRNEGELVDNCRKMLELSKDASFIAKLKEDSRFFVEVFDVPYGKRLAEFVKSVLCDSY
jgi:hypothetical protein